VPKWLNIESRMRKQCPGRCVRIRINHFTAERSSQSKAITSSQLLCLYTVVVKVEDQAKNYKKKNP
jgi:hypothetical protein